APYAHYALGQSLKRLGRRDEAGTHLRLAVALSPGSKLYRDALARLPSGSRRPPSVGTNEDAERPPTDDEGSGPSDPA
ncbi:MAG TPA: tetratricopeptide repeat protein, partial [Methylomirabilota bacterium]|nr:tetratricopeptide repeat protein [Methylomirabilota bacterium]